jgi:hypothetical protein
MQKYGGVAMLTEKINNEISFLFPVKPDIESFIKQPATSPFSGEAVSFLHALSLELTRNSTEYPEVAALAFFCRKGNILQLKKEYADTKVLRSGRGIVFHIAPSNVPLNFAYSLVCGILSGNSNVVRVPSKEFEQIKIVSRAIEKIQLDVQYRTIADRIMLLRYDRQSAATEYFSSICDVRIIWGGDSTIEQIRKAGIPARAFDVTFADRYSFCVINADEYIHEKNPEKIASGFYNDTYLFDQNACTSPHLLVWLGEDENIEKSKNTFWKELHKVVKQKYPAIQPIVAVDKLTSFYAQAAGSGDISKIYTVDNLIWRIQLKQLPYNIDSYRCAGGYFSEYNASSLSELGNCINRKYQTMAYYGIPENVLRNFITDQLPSGIDRIIPIGRTSDFSLTWDGFDLINSLSRRIEILTGVSVSN